MLEYNFNYMKQRIKRFTLAHSRFTQLVYWYFFYFVLLIFYHIANENLNKNKDFLINDISDHIIMWSQHFDLIITWF